MGNQKIVPSKLIKRVKHQHEPKQLRRPKQMILWGKAVGSISCSARGGRMSGQQEQCLYNAAPFRIDRHIIGGGIAVDIQQNTTLVYEPSKRVHVNVFRRCYTN